MMPSFKKILFTLLFSFQALLGFTDVIVMNPEPNSEVSGENLLIAASFIGINNVDPGRIRLMIDGNDFTEESFIDNDMVTCLIEFMEPGTHKIDLFFLDMAEPVSWEFTSTAIDDPIKYSGRIKSSSSLDQIDDQNLSVNKLNIDFSGSAMDWLTFNSNIKVTSQENQLYQPRNVYGFNFGINFKRPYLASSFQDFWRRWHISLSRWLKDYLYIPLGGNRYGTLNKYKSLLVVMFLGGLWHGASVNFIIWGMLHGILLIINDFLKKKKISLSQNLNKLIVFFVVSILWIIFRSDNLLITKLKFKKLCEFETFFQNFTYDLFNLLIGFTMILIVLSKDFLEERKIRMSKNYRIILSLIFIWLISFVGIFEGSNFIYFKF